MKAKIRSFHISGSLNPNQFSPTDPENFSFLLELMVGPENADGAEIFDVQVCTPKWFLSTMKKNDVILGRHFLIVLEYDFDRIINRVRHLIETCTGNNWDEVAEKVSRIGHWEFEDYNENQP